MDWVRGGTRHETARAVGFGALGTSLPCNPEIHLHVGRCSSAGLQAVSRKAVTDTQSRFVRPVSASGTPTTHPPRKAAAPSTPAIFTADASEAGLKTGVYSDAER